MRSVSARGRRGVASKVHQFYAIAFEENFSLRQISPAFPEARVTPLELYVPIPPESGLYIFPFGAAVLVDVPAEKRDGEMARLRALMPKLTTQVIREDYSVREDPDSSVGITGGMLTVDQVTRPRAGIVALIVAQSAAMEYYERIVETMFARTARFIEDLERRGTVPFRIRPLHRFIGEAINTRTEVLAVLHLLDKPDATWEDPAMDRIYDDLRAEFDLADRYEAMAAKIAGIQQSLELLLDVGRDRRLIFLEAVVALLIVLEVVLGVLQLGVLHFHLS
jgi:required for meiotic nuclear division protein 1